MSSRFEGMRSRERDLLTCGERLEPEALTVDHVKSRMRGGDRSGGNLVTACGACNARKGGLRLADFLRSDPIAHKNFFVLAARHVWPRILRTVEEELAKSARPAPDS